MAAFATEATTLKDLLNQATRYPFLNALGPVTERVGKLADKDYAHLLNQLQEFSGELLDAKEDLLDPIKSFMAGAQRTAYDEAIAYLREEEANFADLPPSAVQPLRDLAASLVF